MARFTDRNNKQWDCELTIATARRSFDINKPEEISQLLEDPYKRFDFLWFICEAQANAAGIDANAFDLLLSDESTYVAANEALLESIESFFRRIGKESLALLMAKSREAALTLEKIASEKVTGEQMKKTLTQVITKAADHIDAEITKAGKLSLSSPVLSESTPTP